MQPGIKNFREEPQMTSTTKPQPYIPPAHFVAWLDAEEGRAAYFSKVDPGLFPPLITKMKKGEIPITFEYAVRLERAQKASNERLTAESLMTFLEHRQLYRYVTGQEPAPAPVQVVRKPRARKDLTKAEA
jgi:hypothetical protein